MTTTMLGCCCR